MQKANHYFHILNTSEIQRQVNPQQTAELFQHPNTPILCPLSMSPPLLAQIEEISLPNFDIPNPEKIGIQDPLSHLQPVEIKQDVTDVEAQDIKNETAHDINVYVVLNFAQDIILMNVQTMKINNLEKIYLKHWQITTTITTIQMMEKDNKNKPSRCSNVAITPNLCKPLSKII